jgi:hypothetical protein
LFSIEARVGDSAGRPVPFQKEAGPQYNTCCLSAALVFSFWLLGEYPDYLVKDMGLRFRRSLGLIPGVRLNLGLKSGSVSFGVRGLHYTVGTKGSRVTVGLPGTGLFWTKKINSTLGTSQPGQVNQRQTYLPPTGGGAQPAQLRQAQTYLPPTGGTAQLGQLRQPQTNLPHIGGAAQPAQLSQAQMRMQSIGGGIQSPPTTHTHFFVPLWLVWAMLAVIVIAGLCIAAAMIGSVSASRPLNSSHRNSTISFLSGNCIAS